VGEALVAGRGGGTSWGAGFGKQGDGRMLGHVQVTRLPM